MIHTHSWMAYIIKLKFRFICFNNIHTHMNILYRHIRTNLYSFSSLTIVS